MKLYVRRENSAAVSGPNDLLGPPTQDSTCTKVKMYVTNWYSGLIVVHKEEEKIQKKNSRWVRQRVQGFLIRKQSSYQTRQQRIIRKMKNYLNTNNTITLVLNSTNLMRISGCELTTNNATMSV